MNDAKTALGHKILAIKQQRKLTWTEIAARLGHAPTWVCAACLGQMSMTAETAAEAALLFGLDDAETALLQAIPYRGSLPTQVPTDPLIYRAERPELVDVGPGRERLVAGAGDHQRPHIAGISRDRRQPFVHREGQRITRLRPVERDMPDPVPRLIQQLITHLLAPRHHAPVLRRHAGTA